MSGITTPIRGTVGPHSMIVRVLKDYGEAPVDFVAELIGATTDDMDGYLATMQEDGVVVVDSSRGRDNATVRLK